MMALNKRMLLPARFYVAAALLLALTACGFQPLLSRNTDAPEQLSQIRIRNIENRSGQILHNHLRDDLAPRGTPATPRYILEVTLSEPQQEIAIRRDESASRVAYSANATFVLRDSAGRSLFASSATSSSTYEATNSEFASIAGQRNARDRAMQEISADIRRQLAAYFGRPQSSP